MTLPHEPDPETEVVAYTPEPEHRPDWVRSAWLDPAPGEPSSGTSPAPTEPVGASPTSTATNGGDREPRRVGLGSIVVASVLSAVLASGGTVALLSSSGALNHPITPGSS